MRGEERGVQSICANLEKRHAQLASNSVGQHGLAATRWAVQQDTAGWRKPQMDKELRVCEHEFHQLAYVCRA